MSEQMITRLNRSKGSWKRLNIGALVDFTETVNLIIE